MTARLVARCKTSITCQVLKVTKQQDVTCFSVSTLIYENTCLKACMPFTALMHPTELKAYNMLLKVKQHSGGYL